METLSEGLLWSRCCEVAARVYRQLSTWNDRAFADRILANTLGIPERMAARLAADTQASRAAHALAMIEALTVLQTQLYLACECGLIERDESNSLCFEAATLAQRLAETHELPAHRDRDSRKIPLSYAPT